MTAVAGMGFGRDDLNRTAEVRGSCPRLVGGWRPTLLLPGVVLVCHSRGRSLDMISPALLICMETARARLALAGRPVRPRVGNSQA